MNDTQEGAAGNTAPRDPVMAAPDPMMFASLTRDENRILIAHLTSGWYKQSAVYPVLSEPWRETAAVLDDLGWAWQAAWQAAQQARARQAAGPEAPEAGS